MTKRRLKPATGRLYGPRFRSWANYATHNIDKWMRNTDALNRLRLLTAPKTALEVKAFVMTCWPLGTPDMKDRAYCGYGPEVDWQELADRWANEYYDRPPQGGQRRQATSKEPELDTSPVGILITKHAAQADYRIQQREKARAAELQRKADKAVRKPKG